MPAPQLLVFQFSNGCFTEKTNLMITPTAEGGDVAPTAEQRTLHQAHAQIQHNTSILKPGMTFHEVAEKALSLPPDYLPQRYSVLYPQTHSQSLSKRDAADLIAFLQTFD